MGTNDRITGPIASPAGGTSFSGALLAAALIAALGGFLFGYDTGVISAALLYIKQSFALSQGLQEITVAAVLLGAIIGVLGSGPVVDVLGRRRTLLIAAAVFVVGALGSGMAPNVKVLLAARFVLGVAIGASSLIVPTYIAELAPRRVRGRLVSLQQLMIAVGIFVSYLVGFAFSASHQWRWMLGIAAVPSAVMFAGLLGLPESPRWLLLRGREAEARKIMLRTHSARETGEEIQEIKGCAAEESRFSYRDVLGPQLRPALAIGVAVAATNQLVGVNAVIYYTPTILTQAGFGSSAAILSSVGIGLVNMIVTLTGLMLVDRVGRRPLLLGGTAVVIAALLFIVGLYLLPSRHGVVGMLLVAGLCVYIAAFATSLGLGIWLINSEIFPTAVRGKAAAFGTVTHWGLDFLIALTVLTLISALTPPGLFGLFAVFGVLGWVFLFRRLPETKGRSLEDIWQSLRAQARPRVRPAPPRPV